MKATPAASAATIHVVAAVIQNQAGQLLLVRKTGTQAFMQPGGKSEPGESEEATLARELQEELGCHIVPGSAQFLGHYSAPAINEPGHIVAAALYQVAITGEIKAAAEIAEWIWLDILAPTTIPLAPLTREQVLPLLQ